MTKKTTYQVQAHLCGSWIPASHMYPKDRCDFDNRQEAMREFSKKWTGGLYRYRLVSMTVLDEA